MAKSLYTVFRILICYLVLLIWTTEDHKAYARTNRVTQNFSLPGWINEELPTETGIASHYADRLHGNTTANGEEYDRNAFTAAHRKYPYGTFVRVTNLKNGKSVIVRINDRGPYRKGRIIDLSKRAARKIDLVKPGITKVNVEVMN